MTVNTMTPMQQFNQLVEEADHQTGYQFDRLPVQELVKALVAYGMPCTALAIKRLAIELGLWRRN